MFSTCVETKSTNTIVGFFGKTLPLISLQINNKTAYFIIDSGSGVSLIHSDYLNKYGLVPVDNDTDLLVHGLGGSEYVNSIIENASILLKGRHIDVSLYPYDLSLIVDSIQRGEGISITGILGNDFLSRYGAIISYNQKTIELIK